MAVPTPLSQPCLAPQVPWVKITGFCGTEPVIALKRLLRSLRSWRATLASHTPREALERGSRALQQTVPAKSLACRSETYKDLQEITAESGWQVTVLPESRKVRGRMTSYRVRATKAPSQKILRVIHADEIVTLQIDTPQDKKEQPQEQMQTPSTWAEAVKMGLGRSRALPNPEVPAAGDYWREDEEMDTTDHWEDNIDPPYDADPYQDAFVEELGPSPRGNPPAKRPKYTRESDKRMDRLEEQMSLLQTQIQTLVTSLTSRPPDGSLPERSPASRATIPLDQTFDIGLYPPHKVDGDGACLWHSCHALAMNREGTPGTNADGHAFKQSMLAKLQGDTARVFVGVPGAGVVGAIEEWAAPDAWADARALLSVGALYGVNVLVINTKDNTLELLFAESQKSAPTWVLHFSGDHYSPGNVRSKEHPTAIVQRATLEAWQRNPLLRGGGLT